MAPINLIPWSQFTLFNGAGVAQFHPFSNFRFTLQRRATSIGNKRLWLSSGSHRTELDEYRASNMIVFKKTRLNSHV